MAEMDDLGEDWTQIIGLDDRVKVELVEQIMIALTTATPRGIRPCRQGHLIVLGGTVPYVFRQGKNGGGEVKTGGTKPIFRPDCLVANKLLTQIKAEGSTGVSLTLLGRRQS